MNHGFWYMAEATMHGYGYGDGYDYDKQAKTF